MRLHGDSATFAGADETLFADPHMEELKVEQIHFSRAFDRFARHSCCARTRRMRARDQSRMDVRDAATVRRGT